MKKWIVLVLILSFGLQSYAQEEVKEPQQLYAQSAVLMDADSGRVLFEKNGMDVKAMASTTKIMTCILALEQGNLDTIVTFSKNAVSQPKVHLGASEHEQFYMKDLLYSLMLESHNDVAVAIAEGVSGSVETFAKIMNEKAKEIGCENTYFITPNGLDAEDMNGKHSTTAVDLAKIMSYCITKSPKKEQFLEITQAPQYQFSNIKGSRTYSCTNYNSFLNMMEEAISGKTGYTNDAGYCYAGAVESEGRTLVVSLLACGWPNHKDYKWTDMKKLATYGLNAYEYQAIEKVSEIEEIEVVNGIPKSNQLFDTAKVTLKVQNPEENLHILKKQDEEIWYEISKKTSISAPVKKGEVVGEIIYYLEEEQLVSYPIIIEETVKKQDFTWFFQKIAEKYLKI